MLRINKKTEYALISLRQIKDAGERLTTARNICDKFGLPFDTTSKVLQSMKEAGLVKSTKGIKGGYSLAKDLTQTTFMQLVRIVENKSFEGPCVSEKGPCEHFNNCNIKTPMTTVNLKVTQFLDNVTLDELLRLNNDSETEMTGAVL